MVLVPAMNQASEKETEGQVGLGELELASKQSAPFAVLNVRVK